MSSTRCAKCASPSFFCVTFKKGFFYRKLGIWEQKDFAVKRVTLVGVSRALFICFFRLYSLKGFWPEVLISYTIKCKTKTTLLKHEEYFFKRLLRVLLEERWSTVSISKTLDPLAILLKTVDTMYFCGCTEFSAVKTNF